MKRVHIKKKIGNKTRTLALFKILNNKCNFHNQNAIITSNRSAERSISVFHRVH